VFADELSEQAVGATHELIAAQWQALSTALVPRLEALIEADRAAGRAQDQRLRVGLFSYSERMAKDPSTDIPPTRISKGERS
jgi:hypothetical protein